jgi:uncharacterized protein (DUF1697 family)
MASYAAFLRGMNVGGHRLTNAELRSHFDAMGFGEVASFRASGNVVFEAGTRGVEQVQRQIEQGLERALGYAVPTFLRSAQEMRTIAAAKPFSERELGASRGKLQVALLSACPPARARAEMLMLAGEHDRLAVAGRELFWLPRGGMLESPLAMKLIEQLLGMMTMRTKNTLELLAERHFSS